MAKRGRHSLSKRLREQKRAEKAAHKQARRAERPPPDATLSVTAEDHDAAEGDGGAVPE